MLHMGEICYVISLGQWETIFLNSAVISNQELNLEVQKDYACLNC